MKALRQIGLWLLDLPARAIFATFVLCALPVILMIVALVMALPLTIVTLAMLGVFAIVTLVAVVLALFVVVYVLVVSPDALKRDVTKLRHVREQATRDVS